MIYLNFLRIISLEFILHVLIISDNLCVYLLCLFICAYLKILISFVKIV